jgi:hypothetical protein
MVLKEQNRLLKDLLDIPTREYQIQRIDLLTPLTGLLDPLYYPLPTIGELQSINDQKPTKVKTTIVAFPSIENSIRLRFIEPRVLVI